MAVEPQNPAASVQLVDPVKFSGEVRANELFERRFGKDLVFRLQPLRDAMTPGWVIEVVPKDRSLEAEYTSVLTTPYRFFNPTYLAVGYGFSAREIVEMNGRSFKFVTNQSDFGRAQKLVNILLRGDPTAAGRNFEDVWSDALRDLDRIPFCGGSLKILESDLADSTGPAKQVITRLKFEVELCGPSRQR